MSTSRTRGNKMNTFESAENLATTPRTLTVGGLFGQPRLFINVSGKNTGFIYKQSDAPKIALAVMQEAGFDTDTLERGTLGFAMKYLEQGIEEDQENLTLLAEALGFANKFYGTDWDFFPCTRTAEVDQWLAVARKAREMGVE